MTGKSRLLAFSRRQPLEPKSVSVNSLIAGMSEILHQTLGQTVQIETVLAACAWAIFLEASKPTRKRAAQPRGQCTRRDA